MASTSIRRLTLINTSGTPVSGKYVYAVPQAGSYETDAILMEAVSGQAGTYAAVLEVGEYKIYIGNTPLEADPILHAEHVWVGEDVVTKITARFNASQELTTGGIASNAVTTAKIADSNVTTAKIADANITPVKIADQMTLYTTSEGSADDYAGRLYEPETGMLKVVDISGNIVDIIGTGEITATKIASDAITTAKITDSNVTTAKIADANVTADKLASNAVTEGKIASNAVTNTKIADSTIASTKLNTQLKTITDLSTTTGDYIGQLGVVQGETTTDYSKIYQWQGSTRKWQLLTPIELVGTASGIEETLEEITLPTALTPTTDDLIATSAGSILYWHDQSTGVFYRSEDYGKSWRQGFTATARRQIQTDSTGKVILEKRNSNTSYAYMSLDYGATLIPHATLSAYISDILTPLVGTHTLRGFALSEEGYLYIAVLHTLDESLPTPNYTKHEVFVSKDIVSAGSSFTIESSPIITESVSYNSTTLYATFMDVVGDWIAFSFANNYSYPRFFYKNVDTTSATESYTMLSISGTSSFLNGVMSVSKNGKYIVISISTGIYISSDYGEHWTNKTDKIFAGYMAILDIADDGYVCFHKPASGLQHIYETNDFFATVSQKHFSTTNQTVKLVSGQNTTMNVGTQSSPYVYFIASDGTTTPKLFKYKRKRK